MMSVVKTKLSKVKEINRRFLCIVLSLACYFFSFSFTPTSFGKNNAIAKERIIPSILKCVVPKSKKGKVCIIKTDKGKKGTTVSIYNNNHYWVATGKIHKRKGNKAVVIMKNTIQPIFTSYTIEVGQSSDWKQSFSNHDYW